MSDGGLKYDGGKVPFELLPEDVLEEVARVLAFGARKYAPRNWEKGIAHSRTYGAARRHMVAFFQKGETLDPETRTHHYANAICELAFALAFELRHMRAARVKDSQGNEITLDDRPCVSSAPAPVSIVANVTIDAHEIPYVGSVTFAGDLEHD